MSLEYQSQSPPSKVGLTFSDAREVVSEALRASIAKADETPFTASNLHVYLFFGLPPLFTCCLYGVSFQGLSSGFFSGLIVTMVILFVTAIFNSCVVARIRVAHRTELKHQIKAIADEYEKHVSQCNKESVGEGAADASYNNAPSPTTPSSSSSSSNAGTATGTILAGHSFVNIITAYRNGKW